MCDSLRTLTQFVTDNPSFASVGDVTRIACTTCDTHATCGYVDSREFEAIDRLNPSDRQRREPVERE